MFVISIKKEKIKQERGVKRICGEEEVDILTNVARERLLDEKVTFK